MRSRIIGQHGFTDRTMNRQHKSYRATYQTWHPFSDVATHDLTVPLPSHSSLYGEVPVAVKVVAL